jgi:hypothetical protein
MAWIIKGIEITIVQISALGRYFCLYFNVLKGINEVSAPKAKPYINIHRKEEKKRYIKLIISPPSYCQLYATNNPLQMLNSIAIKAVTLIMCFLLSVVIYMLH